MNRVVHFEIHASDPRRAVAFYQAVFGWHAKPWGNEDYWLLSTGHGAGIDGGLILRRGPPPLEAGPVNAFVCTVDVDSLDLAIGNVELAGGRIVVPKAAVPGIGWLAYANDTEGNIFGLMQNDPSAR